MKIVLVNSELLFRVSSDPHFGNGHLARMRAIRLCCDNPASWFVDPHSIDSQVTNSCNDKIIEESASNSVDKVLSVQKELQPKLFYVTAIR